MQVHIKRFHGGIGYPTKEKSDPAIQQFTTNIKENENNNFRPVHYQHQRHAISFSGPVQSIHASEKKGNSKDEISAFINEWQEYWSPWIEYGELLRRLYQMSSPKPGSMIKNIDYDRIVTPPSVRSSADNSMKTENNSVHLDTAPGFKGIICTACMSSYVYQTFNVRLQPLSKKSNNHNCSPEELDKGQRRARKIGVNKRLDEIHKELLDCLWNNANKWLGEEPIYLHAEEIPSLDLSAPMQQNMLSLQDFVILGNVHHEH